MNRSQSEIMKYLQSRKTPATTGEITEKLGLTRQAILVNLKELLNKGYVSQSKKGRSFTWEMQINEEIEEIKKRIIKEISGLKGTKWEGKPLSVGLIQRKAYNKSFSRTKIEKALKSLVGEGKFSTVMFENRIGDKVLRYKFEGKYHYS